MEQESGLPGPTEEMHSEDGNPMQDADNTSPANPQQQLVSLQTDRVTLLDAINENEVKEMERRMSAAKNTSNWDLISDVYELVDKEWTEILRSN